MANDETLFSSNRRLNETVGGMAAKNKQRLRGDLIIDNKIKELSLMIETLKVIRHSIPWDELSPEQETQIYLTLVQSLV